MANRVALVALYLATDGDDWHRNDGWLSDSPLDQWHGVVTDDLGNVTDLLLADNNLAGVIPPEIGQLAALATLELQGNALSGGIPPELGGLVNLYFLDLRNNMISGSIPGALAELPRLQALFVGSNSLTGCIPTGLKPSDGSPHVVTWNVNEDPLRYCDASHPDDRAATPLPTPNPDLPLETLALIAFYDATDGTNWKVNSNWRTDSPVSTWFGVQTDAQGRVTHLELPDNNLSGHVPAEIGHLKELQHVILYGNELTGAIPPEVGELENLEMLDLSTNELSGSIPMQLGNLTKMSQLLLSYNDLAGPIPTELGDMSRVGSISLQGNRLTGDIPTELARLNMLYGLDLAGNALEGNIPKALEQLEHLVYLDVSNNRLSGEVSEWPTNLASLSQLRVSDNDFSGCIPDELREINDNDFIYSNLSYCGEPPKHQPASPDFVEWVIGDDVSRSEERAARLGFQWLYEYGLSVGWPIAGETITIHLDDELGLARMLTNEDGLVEPGEFEVQLGFIRTVGGFADDDINYNRASSPGYPVQHDITATTVAHENLHIMFQRDLVGRNSERHEDWSGPHWWTEGMAKLITEVAVKSGAPFEERRRFIVETASADRCDAPLSDFEIADSYDLFLCGYDVGALAVELLGSRVGFRNIVRVYTDRQPGWTWQQTFEYAFDMTLQGFYAEFERHRLAGFPAVAHPITVANGQ